MSIRRWTKRFGVMTGGLLLPLAMALGPAHAEPPPEAVSTQDPDSSITINQEVTFICAVHGAESATLENLCNLHVVTPIFIQPVIGQLIVAASVDVEAAVDDGVSDDDDVANGENGLPEDDGVSDDDDVANGENGLPEDDENGIPEDDENGLPEDDDEGPANGDEPVEDEDDENDDAVGDEDGDDEDEDEEEQDGEDLS